MGCWGTCDDRGCLRWQGVDPTPEGTWVISSQLQGHGSIWGSPTFELCPASPPPRRMLVVAKAGNSPGVAGLVPLPHALGIILALGHVCWDQGRRPGADGGTEQCHLHRQLCQLHRQCCACCLPRAPLLGVLASCSSAHSPWRAVSGPRLQTAQLRCVLEAARAQGLREQGVADQGRGVWLGPVPSLLPMALQGPDSVSDGCVGAARHVIPSVEVIVHPTKAGAQRDRGPGRGMDREEGGRMSVSQHTPGR